MSQRVATLMAKLEGGENGDTGRVREWLARAVNAPRDPAWTADGLVSTTWAPISPSGRLDAFEWKVPTADLNELGRDAITARTESLVALGAPGSRPSRPAAHAAPSASAQAAARHDPRPDSAATIDIDTPRHASNAVRPAAARPNSHGDIEDAIELPITQPVRGAPRSDDGARADKTAATEAATVTGKTASDIPSRRTA